MQFSESWLRSFCDPDITSDELSHRLTMAGLEVEEVEPVAAVFSNVVVAQVREVAPHPNADRLRVCQVDAGTGTLLNIVCGAANVRPGMKTVCALSGAVLPPGADGKRFEIKTGSLRGVESQGMLCSAQELKLAAQSDGLLELPDDAPAGQNFRDYYQLNDLRFTIKLTPNRADCLSLLGVAREVAALTGAPLKQPSCEPVAASMNERLPVKIAAADLCGRFSGRVIRNVNARAPTPLWMRQRLERSGLHSISALVDISNYVMLELGRPSHVFDLDRLRGGLEVRWGRKGESAVLLNGETVQADDWLGVIADENGIQALAGIMGGEQSSVTLDTRNIYLEAAFWWPDAIQGRGRRLNFSSDAAHRFERGVDFATTAEHLERITALIVEICGIPGQTALGPVDDQITKLPQRLPVAMRRARAEKILGIALPEARIAEIFTRLGLKHELRDGVFSVTPPSFRFDLEIEEDLIEEVARMVGYDNIPASPPVAANAMRTSPENQRSAFDIRRQLADFDFQEVVNYSFVEQEWEADFSGNADPVRLLNPIASQMSVMRSSLIGSLVANLRHNLNRKADRVRIFEIGAVYLLDASQRDAAHAVPGYSQPKRLAALAYGSAAAEQWGQATRETDFFDLKADLEALFAPVALRFEGAAHPALHPGRSATVMLDGKTIGIIGELHPRWQQKYDLPRAPLVFEVDLAAAQCRPLPAYREVPKFPPVSRDIALIVDRTVKAQALLDAMLAEIQGNPQCEIVQAIVLFDEYRGKGLENNEKSLAFRVTLQDTRNTLQDEAVDAAVGALVARAAGNHGAKLRN